MTDLYRMINAAAPGNVRYIQYNTHYIEYNFSVWQINPRRLDMAAAAGPGYQRSSASGGGSARGWVRLGVGQGPS